jgi:hypothetical protein
MTPLTFEVKTYRVIVGTSSTRVPIRGTHVP